MKSRLHRVAQLASGFAVLPMLLVLRLLRPWLSLELCVVGSQRFGHLALEPEVFLSRLEVTGPSLGPRTLHFWSFGRKNVQSNCVLAKMWKREVRLAPGILVGALIRGGEIVPSLSLVVTPLSIHGPFNVLDRTDSHLQRQVNADSRTMLQRIGVKPGTPYVCVAIRDASYYARTGTRESKGYSILNFELATFEAAVRRLIAHGFAVVRMGTQTSNTMPDIPGFIDYANSPLRDELSDITLIRDCEFVLSTQTGIDAVALALRRPVMYVDTVRLSQFFLGTRLATWNPVKFVPSDGGVPMNLSEMLNSSFMWMEDPDEFLKSGTQFLRSSSVEIESMVDSYVRERRGQAPSEWGSLRVLANNRMTMALGARGQAIWGDVTAQLNGWWLEQNHEWFLAS